jgi:hypothetical protein
MTNPTLISMCSACALVAGLVTATFADPEPRPEAKRRPPPAAFAACERAREGDACQFEAPKRQRKVEGTCRKPPNQERLVCRPATRTDDAGGDKRPDRKDPS